MNSPLTQLSTNLAMNPQNILMNQGTQPPASMNNSCIETTQNNKSVKRFVMSSVLSRVVAFAAVCVLGLFASPAKGAIETLPSGSYIIPMDNTLQPGAGGFNLKSYGLAVRLLHAGVPLKWIINPSKGKDGVDFTASAARIKPSAAGAATLSFRAGPLAVYPGFEAQALTVINAYGNNVAVYQLNGAASVPVYSNILHKPKVAVFNQGGNAAIHTAVLAEAGLTSGTHYQIFTNATQIAPDSCFTVATEPHADVEKVSAAATTALLSFLRSGGNFHGQCEAVEAYTTRGLLANFQSKQDLGGTMQFDNFFEPMAQFQGGLDDEGGSVVSFNLTSNPGYRIAYSSASGSRYKAYVGRVTGVTTTNGGWVQYLAGHKYDGGGVTGMNGRRILMNAVLRPSDRPQACGLSLASDIAVTKIVNNSTPQVGSNVTFTISAINNGPLNATGVVVNDILPTGLTYVSHTVTAGTYTPGTGVWSIGSLANGASRTMTITATVTSAAIPSRTNTAVVSANEPDSNTSNNTASATVNPLYANLAVVKTVDFSTQTVGQNVVFTILASNLGPSNATGVVMNDLLPAGLVYVSHTASAGTYNPGTGVWTIGSLANGASRTLTITATVTSAGLPQVTNIATITGNEYDPQLTNNTSVVTVTPQLSDLVVIKTVDNGAQQVGGNVVFTIVARNDGPTANTGVVVNDPLPAGLNYVSHVATFGTYTPGSGVWTIGNLAVGQQYTLTITATVTGAAIPTVVNTATIGGNVFDPDLSNNTSSISVSPNLAVDLGIVKTANNTTPLLGANVTFTLVVTNYGPQNGTGVIAQDLMPAGLVYVSHSTATGTYTPGTGIWAIGNLANGASATLTVTATTTQAAVPSVTNVGIVSGKESDPNLTNNTDPETITPNVLTDLRIVKTVNNSNPVVGTNVTFTVVVYNDGPSNATGVLAYDLLPPGLVYVSHTTSTGIYIPITGLWTIGNIPNGGSRSLTITAATTLTAGANVINMATTEGIENDPNLNNNVDQVPITIRSGADLQIVKTVNQSQPKIGEVVTFTLVVTNNGPEAANGVVVTDELPIGFANPTNISNGGSYDSGSRTITWPPFNMTVGQSITLTLQATVVRAN
jgi:uncharacterized repeat protein (TIGR01451 family)